MLVLATIANVAYGTIFYAFSVLLGENATAGEFDRALLNDALRLGVILSSALAPIVGTLCHVAGSRWVFFTGVLLGRRDLRPCRKAIEGWEVLASGALLVGPAMAWVMGK